MRIQSFALPVLMCLAVSGCGSMITDNDPVTMVEADDAEMNAAIDQARGTVSEFIAALAAPKAGQSEFTVKVGVVDGAEVEHMWLANPTYVNGQFSGAISNDPEMVSNVKYGDLYTVAEQEISDWMFVENGVLKGGYTLRVLRNQLSPTERAQFDKSVGFRIE